MPAVHVLGNQADAQRARVGLAVLIAGAAVVIWRDPATDTVFVPLLFALIWVASSAVRERAAAAGAQARLAAAEDRTRIAREMHDMVGHAVSVMVLQVGAVRHRLPAALAEDAAALKDVEQAGRTALREMRQLLGALRNADEDPDLAPQPGLRDLEPRRQSVRRAGLDVQLRVDGDPVPLPPALDLSA